MAHGNFIYGDLFQTLQFGAKIMLFEIAFLNLFDDIPTHTEMPGNVQNGHVPAQLQGIAFEGLCIAAPRVGKSDSVLPHKTTGQTQQALNPHHYPEQLSPYGQGQLL